MPVIVYAHMYLLTGVGIRQQADHVIRTVLPLRQRPGVFKPGVSRLRELAFMPS